MKITSCMFLDLLRGLLEIVNHAITTKIRTLDALREVFAIVIKKALLTLVDMDSPVLIIQANTTKAGKNLKESKLKLLEHPANSRKNIKISL